MKHAWVVGLFAVMTVGVCSIAYAQGSAKPRAALTKPYVGNLGQQVAGTISDLLGTMKPIDAPMMAIFNGQKIEIWVFGGRGTVDGAKETMDKFRNQASPMIRAMIGSLYGVRLEDDQIIEVYFNREDGNKEIVRLENGVYTAR
jgi:hypothetical protein